MPGETHHVELWVVEVLIAEAVFLQLSRDGSLIAGGHPAHDRLKHASKSLQHHEDMTEGSGVHRVHARGFDVHAQTHAAQQLMSCMYSAAAY